MSSGVATTQESFWSIIVSVYIGLGRGFFPGNSINTFSKTIWCILRACILYSPCQILIAVECERRWTFGDLSAPTKLDSMTSSNKKSSHVLDRSLFNISGGKVMTFLPPPSLPLRTPIPFGNGGLPLSNFLYVAQKNPSHEKKENSPSSSSCPPKLPLGFVPFSFFSWNWKEEKTVRNLWLTFRSRFFRGVFPRDGREREKNNPYV